MNVGLAARLAGLLLFGGLTFTINKMNAQDSNSATPATAEGLSADFLALGDDDYRAREAATERLIRRGEAITESAEARLREEQDPEICARLRFVLENVAPPTQAVCVVRVASGSVLQPGDVVTHVGGRRIRTRDTLDRAFGGEAGGSTIRVRRAGVPLDVTGIDRSQVVTECEYRTPRGEIIATAIRLLASGYAEQADEKLRELPEGTPDEELSAGLRTQIAYLAGHDGGFDLLKEDAEIARPAETAEFAPEWTAVSRLDLSGPGKAPYHIEWELLSAGNYAGNDDPDLRVQRILVPAMRFADALQRSATLWAAQSRAPQDADLRINMSGNLLAVCAWMFYEMDLQSECQRLIEPRSILLSRSSSGLRKWVRVQTDAWLPFFAGDVKKAIETLHPHAREIFSPMGANQRYTLIRNPRIAATIGFFLYQNPDDSRVREMLGMVLATGGPAVGDYLRWMLYSLTPANAAVVRRDAFEIVPKLPLDQMAFGGRALALLEYVRPSVDRVVMASAREFINAGPDTAERGYWLGVLEALQCLADGRGRDAAKALEAASGGTGLDVLRTTAAFLDSPPAGAAGMPALKNPLLATPIGLDGKSWLVLTRDAKLVIFETTRADLAVVEPPSATWVPGPLNWPWIGRDEKTGRVWVYDRHRLAEVKARPDSPPLRFSLSWSQIALFERWVKPTFGDVADGLVRQAPPSGEAGEYLRSELAANQEFAADVDLHEVGVLSGIDAGERLVQLSFRGGPHFVIDTQSGRVVSSVEIGQQLQEAEIVRFIARAMIRDGREDVLLLSNVGAIRVDMSTGQATRLDLPNQLTRKEVIPEWSPYERRDARWVYFARPRSEGGDVFRLDVATNRVETVEMIQEALPAEYYDIMSRAELRQTVDAALQEVGGRDGLVRAAIELTDRLRPGGPQ